MKARRLGLRSPEDLCALAVQRESDPEDMDDVDFLIRHDGITLDQMEPAFATVRMPDIPELHEAFFSRAARGAEVVRKPRLTRSRFTDNQRRTARTKAHRLAPKQPRQWATQLNNNREEDYPAFFSQVRTTKRVALSPRLVIACSFVSSEVPSVTTVTFCVPSFSPLSILTDLKPGNVPNAELTLFLHPPQVTPVIPAT